MYLHAKLSFNGPFAIPTDQLVDHLHANNVLSKKALLGDTLTLIARF